MTSQAGWRIVHGRARYWDGDQWVGGDFDPETISSQMLAKEAGSAAPSVASTYQPAAPSSPYGGMAAAPAPTPTAPPRPPQGSTGARPAPVAYPDPTSPQWMADLVQGRLPGTTSPGARPAPPASSSPSSGAAGSPTAMPRAPLGANPPQTPASQADAGRKVKRLIGFIVGGWILIQILGGLLGQLD
ncbi:hypothetical protein [Demequina salsinemoris]|uniref:hypothetical protein n=1 Tax=Demequina salsinemoris TaxID=577470 RepID=UPI000A9EEF83|nr:hypothetical protein [Demequina salsinemoris]